MSEVQVFDGTGELHPIDKAVLDKEAEERENANRIRNSLMRALVALPPYDMSEDNHFKRQELIELCLVIR